MKIIVSLSSTNSMMVLLLARQTWRYVEDAWGNGGRDPCIINVGNKRRWVVVQLSITVALPPRKEPRHPQDRRRVGHRTGVEVVARRKILFCQESNHGRPIPSHVATPTVMTPVPLNIFWHNVCRFCLLLVWSLALSPQATCAAACSSLLVHRRLGERQCRRWRQRASPKRRLTTRSLRGARTQKI